MFIDMRMDFTVSPTQKDRLEKFIQKEIIKQIKQRLKNAASYLEMNLQFKLKNLIQQHSEFQELISGSLRYDMGITQDEALLVTDKIPDIISQTLKVELITGSDHIELLVKMIDQGYKEILDMKEATFIQTFTRKTPYPIPWLQWLLLEGDKMIVGEYHIRYVQDDTNSRSGGAIMVARGSWRVPPQFSGTETNNMITRSLDGIEEFIFDEIQKFL